MNTFVRAVPDRAPSTLGTVLDLPPQMRAAGNPVLEVLAPQPDDPATAPPAKGPLLRRLIGWIARKLRARKNRMALLELNDEQLKDIGLSRCQAYGTASHYRLGNAHRLERNGR